jgi:copper chaperone CopZ
MAANATLEFSVRGMTCQNCARHAAEAIRSVPGVTEASIDLAAGRARVRWGDPAIADAAAVIAALQRVGFPAALLAPAPAAPETGAASAGSGRGAPGDGRPN